MMGFEGLVVGKTGAWVSEDVYKALEGKIAAEVRGSGGVPMLLKVEEC
jgi:hypothetical protein